jgi:hypothetical protein
MVVLMVAHTTSCTGIIAIATAPTTTQDWY